MFWSASSMAHYSIPTNRAEIFSRNMPNDAMEALHELSPNGIASFSFTPSGGWCIVSLDGQMLSKSIPAECKAKIAAFVKAGHKIQTVAFPPQGSSSYLIVTDKDFVGKQIGKGLLQKLTSLKSKGTQVKHVAFRPKRGNSRWVIITDNGFIAQNIPDDCYQILYNLQQPTQPNGSPTRMTHHVSFSQTGGWCVMADDYFHSKNIPSECLSKMGNVKGQYMQVDLVTFAPNGGGWCVISNQSISNQPIDEIRVFEREVRGGGIWRRMGISKVPGVSVATIVDNKLAWSCGYGFLKTGDVHAAHHDSVYQAGSMSQLVSTIGALRMVRLGDISLEEDLREEKFGLDIPITIDYELLEGQEPTLAMILANRCGFNIKGLRGYSKGRKLPNIDNILKGTGGANNPKVEIKTPPNTNYQPSSGGFIVLDKLIQNTTKQTASQWLNQNVLSPLGMKNSTFNIQPNSQWLSDSNVAAGHNPNGGTLNGERLLYPETSAYGLYTNAQDLANVITMINQGGSYNGQTFLTTDLVESLLTPVNELEKHNRGLGLNITPFGDINYDGSNFRYLASGQCGGFRSLIVGYPIQGTGVVVMSNGNAKDGPRFCYDVAMSVAKAYGWENS
jgi:CubicO group peptidase (beta-lactamase class C family)